MKADVGRVGECKLDANKGAFDTFQCMYLASPEPPGTVRDFPLTILLANIRKLWSSRLRGQGKDS